MNAQATPGPRALPALPGEDLARIVDALEPTQWRRFSGQRFFFTGGTGFLGRWLVASLLEADRRLGLGCRIDILTRSPQAFAQAMPQVAGAPCVVLRQGDVRDFEFPRGPLDVVVHGATDVALPGTPMDTFTACVDGTRRVLDLAEAGGARDFLLLSSGAVYGRHPVQGPGVAETFTGGPDPTELASAYGEGKRAAEWLACARGQAGGLAVKVARIYAQVGPHLPLDRHFAIGNFIADALAGRDIVVQGDGTPLRSYLHVTDTVTWLWAMVLRGAPGRAWNVGGQEAISIADLARRVSALLDPRCAVRVLGQPKAGEVPQRYAPDVARALAELRPPPPLPLDESIVRTANWIRAHQAQAT